MRYFSPSILDGSVTTAKLANDAVTQAKINTTMSSQSGNIGIQSKVLVALDTFSFFCDTEADMPVSATLDVDMVANFIAVPAANAFFPRFDLRNMDTGSTRDYEVAWHHVDA